MKFEIMKISPFKTILAFAFSILLGVLCYVIAKEADYRNWIVLGAATLSIFLCLGSALALDFPGQRVANIKVTSWLFTILVTATNFAFAPFNFNIVVYGVVITFLTLINIALVNAMVKKQE